MGVHTIFSTVRGPFKSVDRLVLREDLSQGQRVRRFAITFDSGGSTPLRTPPSAPAVNGTSVGNRRVVFMAAPATVEIITLQVQQIFTISVQVLLFSVWRENMCTHCEMNEFHRVYR